MCLLVLLLHTPKCRSEARAPMKTCSTIFQIFPSTFSLRLLLLSIVDSHPMRDMWFLKYIMYRFDGYRYGYRGGWMSANERRRIEKKRIATKLNRSVFFFFSVHVWIFMRPHLHRAHSQSSSCRYLCLMKIHCVSMLWLASSRCWWRCAREMNRLQSALGTVCMRDGETGLKWCVQRVVHANAVLATNNAWQVKRNAFAFRALDLTRPPNTFSPRIRFSSCKAKYIFRRMWC